MGGRQMGMHAANTLLYARNNGASQQEGSVIMEDSALIYSFLKVEIRSLYVLPFP
jgi:hypothetical protein